MPMTEAEYAAKTGRPVLNDLDKIILSNHNILEALTTLIEERPIRTCNSFVRNIGIGFLHTPVPITVTDWPNDEVIATWEETGLFGVGDTHGSAVAALKAELVEAIMDWRAGVYAGDQDMVATLQAYAWHPTPKGD